MNSYVLGFHEIDKAKLMLVGGKGLNLGELSRIEGLQIPDGFCVTTRAYKRAIGHNQEYNALLDQLSLLEVDDREDVYKRQEYNNLNDLSSYMQEYINNIFY